MNKNKLFLALAISALVFVTLACSVNLGTGIAPLPTVYPTQVPATVVPPTAVVPPTVVVPPTAVPPTTVPALTQEQILLNYGYSYVETATSTDGVRTYRIYVNNVQNLQAYIYSTGDMTFMEYGDASGNITTGQYNVMLSAIQDEFGSAVASWVNSTDPQLTTVGQNATTVIGNYTIYMYIDKTTNTNELFECVRITIN